MNSIENIVDEAANIAPIDQRRGTRGGVVGRTGTIKPEEVDWHSLWNEGTNAVMDVPVGGVCEILYGEHKLDR